MSEHKKRFTLEKIKSRHELIKPKAIRARLPIKELKCYEHETPADLPVLDETDATKEHEILNPPCYWGKWNADFSLTGVFQVPHDWDETHIPALRFELGFTPRWDLSHPEALLYIDGKPLAGVDKFHTLIHLPATACDGEEHRFTLHLFTGRWGYYDEKPSHKLFMKTCEIASIDPAARDYIATVRVALETAENLAPEEFARSRLINALDESIIALNTLHPMEDTFYESIPEAHAVLKRGIEKAGAALGVTVNAIGHSHIDVAWLWTLAQTRRKCGRSFNTILSLMEDYPEFKYTQSQPQLYDFVRQDYPDLFEQIKTKVKEGAWEPVGGMWVEADCNLAGSESLARQFLLGRSFFAEHFGEAAESPILWLPDVFGYSANLPQLIKLAGMEYFFTIKLSWSQYNQMPHDSFWWRGLDGTQVLTHLGSTRSSPEKEVTYNGMADPREIHDTWKHCQQKELHEELMTAFGHGDGGGGPTREMLENIQELADFPAMPRVQHSTAIDFFKKLEKTSGDRLPTWDGELYFEYHRGTYTSQARTKRANRKSEFGLHDAEFLSGLASVLDRDFDYPAAALKSAWKLVCLNQFHDIIPGSSIPEVYEDSAKQYAEVSNIIHAVNDDALCHISRSIGGDVLVANPCSFARQGLAYLEQSDNLPSAFQTSTGESVATQQTADGLLIAVPRIEACGVIALVRTETDATVPDTSLSVDETKLENRFIKINFNAEGDIESVYDKIEQRELIPCGECANQFLAFEDRPLAWDAWDIDIFYDDKVFPAAPATSIEVVESGPLRACLEIKRTVLSSSIVQRITLTRDDARLDFQTVVDWNERDVLLKAAFPLELRAPQASFEIQWGHVKRPTHQNTSWDWAKFESCAQKWIDLSEPDYGVSLLNDCKYGHDVKDNVMRITLLRSPGMPDPDADAGRHEFTYSLLPHAGGLSSGTIQQAYALNDPLIAFPSAAEPLAAANAPTSMFSVDRDNVIIETIKQAEDGNGIIVRLYEALGSRGAVSLQSDFSVQSCEIVNLLEKPLQPIRLEKSEIRFDIKPFEIITFKIRVTG